MPLSNDDRGWIMTALSGVACVFGASFICVDILIRLLPGKKNFRIQDSDVFLSLSLSLSFGVMLFSALYSILPSSKRSLEAGGHSPKEASWIMIGCFIGGVIGIQIVSRLLHGCIPHNIVDCEHEHGDEETPKERPDPQHDHDHANVVSHDQEHPPMRETTSRTDSNLGALSRPQGNSRSNSYYGMDQSFTSAQTAESEHSQHQQKDGAPTRPRTLQVRIRKSINQLASGADSDCDCEGPCYGYSDLCQQACFRNVTAKGGAKAPLKPSNGAKRPAATKSVTATESTPLLHKVSDDTLHRPNMRAAAEGLANTQDFAPSDESAITPTEVAHDAPEPHHSHGHDAEPDHHHHHVPTNAFLSIGLQTSIAIALHKLPEGFITYATNHANPKLGVSVFLALFIHNITEGFAMALPLYLAINNRIKAMLISLVLGGLSQPIGAAVAALWFRLAGNGRFEPDESVYGAMFAITAGIMASVALQLFSESLDLTHSKHLCMIGAFSGMTILGISSALTA
ncbi:unnamed protein product [Zymoseptoria tritici ST99CH_3D7]|uniref:Zinc/iron permease n=2 Tax=Zymoseptoria tritici TaxID=1047171 RepID=A0A1X7RQT4_ZYMT9|nr:unnamed protein product [Zymoseptoria tritici ST99CH_3D7]SMR49176.1 unnamed protein product [Zymoseptoria tritici ST99CH_1E4]